METIKIYLKKHPQFNDFYEFHWSNKSAVEHKHCDFYEIIITLKPHIKNTVNNESSILDCNCAYIISPRQKHHVVFSEYPASAEPFLFNIALDEHIFCNMCNAISSNIINKINMEKMIKINLTNNEFDYIYYLINKLSKTVDEHTSSTQVKNIVSNLLYIFNTQTDVVANSKLEEYVFNVKEKIDNLEYLTIDIKDIYSKYPVSFSSLIGEFKKITGKTIIDYIINKRMAYAKLLILTTNFSVIDVAQTVGYSSQSFFISKFKEFYGKTPLQYKKDNKHVQ